MTGSYKKKLKPAYQFQTSTFKMLGEKAKHMPNVEHHGNLDSKNNKVFNIKQIFFFILKDSYF